MWTLWITVSAAVLIVLAVSLCLRPAFRAAPIGWRLLSASGIPLNLAGLIFIIRFWQPTAGPYRANELYPYGNHLHAWAVSFGFTWFAFGLLFAGLALLGSRRTGRVVWVTLLASWVICWLPHGVIGLAFACAGHNAPSLETYRKWASESQGFILLVSDAVILLAHFALAMLGFVMSGLEIRRDDHTDLGPPVKGRRGRV
jgi:hypothetical protein